MTFVILGIVTIGVVIPHNNRPVPFNISDKNSVLQANLKAVSVSYKQFQSSILDPVYIDGLQTMVQQLSYVAASVPLIWSLVDLSLSSSDLNQTASQYLSLS